MNGKLKERIIVAVAAVVFFAAFAGIALMDRSHGTNGDGIGANEVNVDVTRVDGHVTIPSIPDSLLVLSAGRSTNLSFDVVNNDRDNDIDTIVVDIPDAEIQNGSTEWYDANFLDHEWLFNATDSDTATFEAQDDWFGRVFGGSAQYDVVGNMDDALDHFEENDTISMTISEGITLTVDFTAPDTPGIKTGNDAMQVSVGDLMTEESATELTPLYSNGYPYLVIDDGYEVIIIDVSSEKVELEVQYGGKTLFSGSTRSINDYKTETEGISYPDNGHTYAILTAPADENVIVKPIVKGTEANLGDVDVKMQEIKVKDVTQTGSDLFEVVEEHEATIPITDIDEAYVDTDGDWDFDITDPDDDNDNITDDRDPEPTIPGTVWINENPTINEITKPEEKVKKGESFTLAVDAEDSDNDPIEFAWSLSGSDWTDTGASVSGPTDLEPGTYTFTVRVTDDKGGETTRTADVEIYKEEEDDTNYLPFIIIGIILLVVVIVVIFFLMKGKGEEEEEGETEELAPEEGMGMGMPEEEHVYETETYEEEEGMDEEQGYEEGDMAPPEPVEEVETPDIGTVPSMEEEEQEAPELPGESEPQEVQDLEQLIDEMERTEEEIGDVCPECNAPLGPYDSECPNCGAQFEIALECPNCGAVVEDNVSECPNCGVSFM